MIFFGLENPSEHGRETDSLLQMCHLGQRLSSADEYPRVFPHRDGKPVSKNAIDCLS